MPCYSPVNAWKTHKGAVVFRPAYGVNEAFQVPCGACVGCLIGRSREWAVRCMHEASLHRENCFITLTYAPEFLPPGGTLVKEHFQLFMKRFRKAVSVPLRYFHCGEYGEKLSRPHYHALIFGYAFTDLEVVSYDKKRGPVYTSKFLRSLWGMGHVTVGDLTWESAAYTARYVLKKKFGSESRRHYSLVDPQTGEITDRLPEYVTMSRSGGIGEKWFDEFYTDVFPSDEVILGARRFKVPRYYDKLLARKMVGPDPLRCIKTRRRESAEARAADNSRSRLAVKSEIKQSQVNRLKRSLHDSEDV
ncbi:MAG: replication initiator protein [Microvirus sp.]|nr:MAG: replication initiator protein [Microvirus sp.]